MYEWLKSYLQNRQQCTVVQHCVSCNATVTCGVLQGSVLGPLLFLICMNDIGKAIRNEKIKLFADDTNLFIFDTDSNGLCLKATDYLDKLNLWFSANTTLIYNTNNTLNTTKTSYMFFILKKMKIQNYYLITQKSRKFSLASI